LVRKLFQSYKIYQLLIKYQSVKSAQLKEKKMFNQIRPVQKKGSKL